MSDQYSGNIDATDPQEPDYESHFADILDKDKFYQMWSEQQETSIEEKERYYEQIESNVAGV